MTVSNHSTSNDIPDDFPDFGGKTIGELTKEEKKALMAMGPKIELSEEMQSIGRTFAELSEEVERAERGEPTDLMTPAKMEAIREGYARMHSAPSVDDLYDIADRQSDRTARRTASEIRRVLQDRDWEKEEKANPFKSENPLTKWEKVKMCIKTHMWLLSAIAGAIGGVFAFAANYTVVHDWVVRTFMD